MCTMAMASSSSSKTRDQSSVHAKQSMFCLNEKFNNASYFSLRDLTELEHQPDLQSSTSSLLVSEENLQQECSSATGHDLERAIFSESALHLLQSVSTGASELARIMQGRVGSHAANGHHLPIPHDSIERGLSGEFGLPFTELSDFWGDMPLYSHDVATAATFPTQKLAWDQASTSYATNRDPVAATASMEYERPPGPRGYGSSISPWAETSVGKGNEIERPPFQPADDSKPSPVATCDTAGNLDPPLIYHHVTTRPPKWEDVSLYPSSSCKPEIPERTLSPSVQPLSSRRIRVHSQPLERSGVQDAAEVEQFSDTVVDSMVLGTRQHNCFQQAQTLSVLSSPDIDRRRQASECGTGGKANHFVCQNLSPLKLKQKSNELSVGRPAPRKYQRRRAVNGNGLEVNILQTPLDHVQRERQRRDLMTSKIAALELLIPKSSKRDRVSVVYDAIHLLKRLERDVKVLQRRHQDLERRKSSSAPSARYKQSIPKSIDDNMGTRGSHFIKGVGKYMKPVVIRTNPTWDKSGSSRPTQGSSMISSALRLGDGNDLDRRNVLVEFHVSLYDTGTIQEEKLLKCRCRMHYLSMMMGVVDEFRLDVISCNIMKLCGYFVCIVGLKTRTRKEKTTAAQFAARLQSLVDVDMADEEVTISLSG